MEESLPENMLKNEGFAFNFEIKRTLNIRKKKLKVIKKLFFKVYIALYLGSIVIIILCLTYPLAPKSN